MDHKEFKEKAIRKMEKLERQFSAANRAYIIGRNEIEEAISILSGGADERHVLRALGVLRSAREHMIETMEM